MIRVTLAVLRPPRTAVSVTSITAPRERRASAVIASAAHAPPEHRTRAARQRSDRERRASTAHALRASAA